MNSSIVNIAFCWNSVVIVCPFESLEEWNIIKQKCKIPNMSLSCIEAFKTKLNTMAATITEYKERKNKPQILCQGDLLQKAFKCDEEKAEDLKMTWILYTFNLFININIDIQNKNNFISILDNPETTSAINELCEIQQKHRVCGLCSAKASKKCPLCPQRYCCPDHQKQDWKKHKTTHN
jgi:hypothetical protein